MKTCWFLDKMGVMPKRVNGNWKRDGWSEIGSVYFRGWDAMPVLIILVLSLFLMPFCQSLQKGEPNPNIPDDFVSLYIAEAQKFFNDSISDSN